MSTYRTTVLIGTLALAGGAFAIDPSAAIRRVVQDDSVRSDRFHWRNPAIVDARTRRPEGWGSVGQYYADYHGRKLETQEVLVGAEITPRIGVFFGRQDILIKGRQATSRFRLSSDSYGFRWVAKPGATDEDPSLAIQFEAVRPGTARARAGNSGASFFATKNNSLAVNYGPWKGLQGQLSYTNVKGAAAGNANVFGLTVGKDFEPAKRFEVRLQGTLVGQSYTDTVEHVGFEVKPVLFGAAAYHLSELFRVEAEGAFMPSGMPLAYGRFTSLSSFQIYRPGGVAEGLRKNAVGFGVLRLMFHKAF